jgi:hypothetical protein
MLAFSSPIRSSYRRISSESAVSMTLDQSSWSSQVRKAASKSAYTMLVGVRPFTSFEAVASFGRERLPLSCQCMPHVPVDDQTGEQIVNSSALASGLGDNLTSFVDRSPGGHGGVGVAPEVLRDDGREEAKSGRTIRDPLQRFAIDFRAVALSARTPLVGLVLAEDGTVEEDLLDRGVPRPGFVSLKVGICDTGVQTWATSYSMTLSR